jgi:hypothetical protein
MKIEQNITKHNKTQIEEIKSITLELIKNGYGSDFIGMDTEKLILFAIKHAKQIYKSKEFLDKIKDEEFLL